MRLRQEYFFASASLLDLVRRHVKQWGDVRTLGKHAAVQLNDTHPAIGIAELMRILVDLNKLEWGEAWSITQETFSYTNHTLLPEALETWPVPLMERVLPRHMQIIYLINAAHLDGAQRRGIVDTDMLAGISLIDEHAERRVRMGNLAFIGSHKVNGVSALHTELMRETVFHTLNSLHPGRIVNKTNGITFRRWLIECNPDLAQIIRSTLGERALDDYRALKALAAYADDYSLQERVAQARRKRKIALARVIADQLNQRVDPEAMFDAQVKRIHEYKRQLLNLLETVARYNAIRANPTSDFAPRVKIFSGKAAASYTQAKLIIKLAIDIAKVVNSDPTVRGLFKSSLPNYNVSLAEIIMPAADLSEQISTAGMEASGTGNMKMALNGALTIGTLDGANVEMRDMVGDDNIFIFGMTAAEVETARANGIDFDRAHLRVAHAARSGRRNRIRRVLDRRRRALSRPRRHAHASRLLQDLFRLRRLLAHTDENRRSLARPEPLAAFERSEHGQRRLVLLRSHDRRIRRGNLESAVRADSLRLLWRPLWGRAGRQGSKISTRSRLGAAPILSRCSDHTRPLMDG